MEYGMEGCYCPDWCYCVKMYLTHVYHSKICTSTVFIRIKVWASISYYWFLTRCLNEWHLFKPRHLIPIVHLSRIEWQVLVPLFMSLIAWLEANTFLKVHGLHSLTKWHKCIQLWKDKKCGKYAVNVQH